MLLLIQCITQKQEFERGCITLENIVFRKATEKDLPQIINLQTRIFNGEQKIPSGDISEFLDRKPQCWCAVLNNIVIGAVAAWKENNAVHWGRFVTDPDYRGNRIGTQIAQMSFDDLFAQGVEEIYMEARAVTAEIVCNMGGQIIGEPEPFYVGTITPVILRKSNYHH